MRARALTISTLAVLLVVGCTTEPSSASAPTEHLQLPNSTSQYPVMLENCGRDVVVASPPQRAVTIDQPATEILLALGLADRMAGTAAWTGPVAPSLAEANATVPVLSTDTPSFERVLTEHPDFVYATFDWSFSNEGVAPRDRFERLGVPTYQSSSECGGQDAAQKRALTLEDLYTEISDVAAVFGVSDRGDELVTSLRSRMTSAAAGSNADGVSLMWWYADTRTPYIAGCCGAPGIITNAVGATNAFADNRQLWPEISWEAILARDPDVLVLADLTRGDDGDSAEAKIRFLESNPVAQRLTAVREHRWIVLSGNAMDPSPRNVEAVETVTSSLRSMGLTS